MRENKCDGHTFGGEHESQKKPFHVERRHADMTLLRVRRCDGKENCGGIDCFERVRGWDQELKLVRIQA